MEPPRTLRMTGKWTAEVQFCSGHSIKPGNLEFKCLHHYGDWAPETSWSHSRRGIWADCLLSINRRQDSAVAPEQGGARNPLLPPPAKDSEQVLNWNSGSGQEKPFFFFPHPPRRSLSERLVAHWLGGLRAARIPMKMVSVIVSLGHPTKANRTVLWGKCFKFSDMS